MENLGYYYTSGTMGSATFIWGFYPKGDKILMMYFTPEAVYTDFPMISGVLISKERYQELMDTCDGSELDDDVIDDIFSVSLDYDNTDIYADTTEDIIDTILENPYAEDIANAWYSSEKDYFYYNRPGSLGWSIQEKLISVLGEEFFDEQADKWNSEPTFSAMLKKIRKYLD